MTVPVTAACSRGRIKRKKAASRTESFFDMSRSSEAGWTVRLRREYAPSGRRVPGRSDGLSLLHGRQMPARRNPVRQRELLRQRLDMLVTTFDVRTITPDPLELVL